MRRTWVWVLSVSVVVGLTALITALAVPHGDSARLGPTNPRPDGARAVLQILRHQGVDVVLSSDSRQVVAATDRDTTLVVTNPELLGASQLQRLAGDDAADLVLIEPNGTALHALAPDLELSGLSKAFTTSPACQDPRAQAAGAARAGGYDYRVSSSGAALPADRPSICYPVRGASDRGSYLVQRRGDRTVTVIGQAELLTNGHLAQDGDAALALSTLGLQPKLLWYTPDPLEPDSAAATSTLSDLLPSWVFWVIVQLCVVVVLAMLWRARRLGGLVAEPLPVVVRAAETQEGRARLYRQSAARDRAGATLRTSTLRRLATRLSAPSGTTPEALVVLVANATGRDRQALHAVLLGPAPPSDAALVVLADELDAVESSLQATTRPIWKASQL